MPPMAKGKNIHDQLFQETLGRQEVARDFLVTYLPEQISRHIDFASMRVCKDSFVDQKLAPHLSDLLYEIRFMGEQPGYVYFLFEHKSSPERFLPLQLLRYMLEIWEHFRKQQKKPRGYKLPLIVPVIIYHGKTRSQGRRLCELIEMPHEELRCYVPDFATAFYDFSPRSDEVIKGEIKLRLALSALCAKNWPESIKHVRDIFILLNQLDESDSSLRWLETIFKYMAEVMDCSRGDLQDIAQKTLSASKEDAMITLAQRLHQEGLQEGLIQGRTEGLSEGRMEGRHAVLERQLRKRFGHEAVGAHVLDMLAQAEADQLDIWAERILDAESIEDVFSNDS